MTIGCNIWMICLKLNWFFYGLSRMFQLPQFVWTPCYSVWDVFNNFLLINATDRSKIISDQKRFFIALSLYPLSFFANTPFKWMILNVDFALKLINYISLTSVKCLKPILIKNFSTIPHYQFNSHTLTVTPLKILTLLCDV